jgi:hypothetical protein
MEVKITALEVETLAALLAKGGAKVTADMIRADMAAGAPTNADGTVNLVHYTAWMNLELTRREAGNGD